jgi:hypothetical protein
MCDANWKKYLLSGGSGILKNLVALRAFVPPVVESLGVDRTQPSITIRAKLRFGGHFLGIRLFFKALHSLIKVYHFESPLQPIVRGFEMRKNIHINFLSSWFGWGLATDRNVVGPFYPVLFGNYQGMRRNV